jgi:hypothetical protein
MRHILSVGFLLCFLSACAPVQSPTPRTAAPPPLPAYAPIKACDRVNVTAVATRQLYDDSYGTMITSNPSSLGVPGGAYRWGIVNSEPLSMAYFASYVKPAGRYGFLKASLYIDPGVRAPMIFLFRNHDRNGEVLQSVTIAPGQIIDVTVPIAGAQRVFIGSELRINHDKAHRIIVGDPEFFNCR